jgi:hypothetical protein
MVKNLQVKMVAGPPDCYYSNINLMRAILVAHNQINLATFGSEIGGEELEPLAVKVLLGRFLA